MAELIDGRLIAKELRAAVKAQVEVLQGYNVVPGLAVILVGDDPASEIYVRNKGRAAEKVGVAAQTIRYAADLSEAEVIAKIAELNADPAIDAILVQSPLPEHMNEQHIQEAISPEKMLTDFILKMLVNYLPIVMGSFPLQIRPVV
ncbi:Bifunctional protein FolD [Weissella viridescens]|uniref:methenyltetrahydrofolate cyclohydrolase n=1 Tax=Weissella viridescens TaxID=1629 RepID=A0A380NZK6_WEIVI|nr:Bifunctional protein FolD [Weissella viridescens]